MFENKTSVIDGAFVVASVSCGKEEIPASIFPNHTISVACWPPAHHLMFCHGFAEVWAGNSSLLTLTFSPCLPPCTDTVADCGLGELQSWPALLLLWEGAELQHECSLAHQHRHYRSLILPVSPSLTFLLLSVGLQLFVRRRADGTLSSSAQRRPACQPLQSKAFTSINPTSPEG